MPISVLKIPLGAALCGSTKRLHKDLMQISTRLNVSRNGVLWSWMQWCKTNSYAPMTQLDCAGQPKPSFLGRPKFQSAPMPARMPVDRVIKCRSCKATGQKEGQPCRSCDGIGHKSHINGQQWLYERAREITPEIGTGILSYMTQDEWKNLSAKVPFGQGGISSLRWQSYLLHEAQLPNARGLHIPIGQGWATIVYNGAASRDVQKNLLHFGKSGCVLIASLFSGESGRQDKVMVVRLNVGSMNPGHRAIIGRVARGEWPMAGSKLVWHAQDKNPAWHFHLSYEQPEVEMRLDKERSAVLFGTPRENRPFRLECTEFGRPSGNVRTLLKRYTHLENKRQYLTGSYRDSAARRSHGRQRIYKELKPLTRKLGNLMAELIRDVAADAVAFCVRNNCGTLQYQEPSLSQRQWSWFANHDLDFNWTKLQLTLEHSCQKAGINYVVGSERRCADADAKNDSNPQTQATKGIAANEITSVLERHKARSPEATKVVARSQLTKPATVTA